MSKEYISIQDAADLCKKSIQTIRRAIKAKKIKIKKQKTPQGFNYLVERDSLYDAYGLKVDVAPPQAAKPEKAKAVKKEVVSETVEKDADSIVVTAEDFKAFARNMERIVSQHSEERQNFLRLVNTLQEKVFVLENQLNLLKAPQRKWYQVWK